MTPNFLHTAKLITASRIATPIVSKTFQSRTFVSTARSMAATVDSNFISRITAAEKTLTNEERPVAGGPTAAAQSHAKQPLTSQVIHEITMGERKITGFDGPVASGPTSIAQSILDASSSGSGDASGVLDSETISKITEKEKELTGEDGPVRRGPTAKAQQHVGEPITSEALHDITEGEKKITGGDRVKGGPTSTAQSELAKSRQ